MNPPALSWKRLSASVGYLKIASFEETGPQALARLDQAFAELVALPSLVIDLRGNRGGTLDMATLLGRLSVSNGPAGWVLCDPRRACETGRPLNGPDEPRLAASLLGKRWA
jgi:hypothetical protein